MDRFLQNIFAGISKGSAYALVALGFNIIYNATGIINFAQGEFVMLGGMLMFFFAVTLKLPLLLAFVATVLCVTLIGLIMERSCINTLKNPSVLTMIMITIAVSIILKGLTMLIAGKEMHTMPFFTDEPESFHVVAGAMMRTQTLWALATLSVVVAVLVVFFNFTMAGKAMRAVSYNRTAAKLMGIPAKRMVMLSFAMSAAIGAMAGAVIMPMTQVDYQSGAMFGVKGFGAAVLGGLGNNMGAVVAGILIGIMESLTAGYWRSDYQHAVPLLILLMVLFVKPSGLFGSEAAGRLKKF